MNQPGFDHYNNKLNIKILLSTYNGESFLQELLESLVRQDFNSFEVVIRDDGSTDKTLSIINTYRKKFPEIIKLIDNNFNENLGVKKSFELLMKSVEADYYLFCDQDDIWEKDKVSLLVNSLLNERQNNGDLPLIAFSDLRIFKSDKVIIESYFKKIGLKLPDLENKLFTCVIPGCCFCFNQEAKKLYFKYSTNYLHDGHLFLLTQLFGRIISNERAFINYRIHSNNVVGYWKKSKKVLLVKDFLKFVLNSSEYRKLILDEYDRNINMLYKQIDNDLLKKNKLYKLSEIDKKSFIHRKEWYINHFKPFKKGIFQGIIEILTF